MKNMQIADQELSSPSGRKPCRSPQKRKILVAVLALILLIGIILAIVFAVKSREKETTEKKPSAGKAQEYKTAAVSADAPQCSVIGKNLLQQGGNAVDAAIGALFCAGVINMHSTGVGGGGFAVVYDQNSKKAVAYDYRETAPSGASTNMFLKNNTSSREGGLAVAIPGEVKGLYTMWKEHGKLNWSQLVEPSRKLAADGFPFPVPVADGIPVAFRIITPSDSLRALLTKDGKPLAAGTTFKNPALGITLEKIRDSPMQFYEGHLAAKIVEEVREAGGIITLDDLKNYNVTKRRILTSSVSDDLLMHIMGPPSSGAVLSMILNIVKGFKFSSDDISTDEKKIASYHKVIEAFKWSYARRALLGDPDFLNKTYVDKVLADLLSDSIATKIREKKISSATHSNVSFYGGYYGKDDFGTSHISVIDKDGMSVSATSTVNFYFGSGVLGNRTGIIYNNEMDDFSTPGKLNLFGYPATKANYIKPGKRPLSSMTPAVLVDKNGKVKMVVGAAGGSMIITAVAETIINSLMFGMELGEAIDTPRYHHQLIPNKVRYEKKLPLKKEILDGLRKIGHVVDGTTSKAVVQGILVDDGRIFAKTDARKESMTAGY